MNPPLSDTSPGTSVPDTLPLLHPVRQKIKDGLVALSLANLCFIAAWQPVYKSAHLSYFENEPITLPILIAVLINILWLAPVIWLTIRAWRHFSNRWFRAACEWWFLLLCVPLLDFVRVRMFEITLFEIGASLKRPLPVVGVLIFLAFIVWKRRWVVRYTAIAVGICSPLALITLVRLALAGLSLTSPPPLLAFPPLPLHSVRPGQPRVVWIIFDEADHRVTFEQRPAGLKLPEFDRLRGGSIYATNAFPPGDDTIRSVPGLISGHWVSEAIPKGASELLLTLADTNTVVGWTELPSVFDSARELGFNTALVGWYHPYARVLGRSLNYCASYPFPDPKYERPKTVGVALELQLRPRRWLWHVTRIYIDTYRAMLADSLSVVTNASYGLVYLHLPPPHWPGIFVPATGGFSLAEQPMAPGYFNNLVLADHTLGKLRQALEASGEWDKSWLILSADHSWRASHTYDGQRDLRVPFLIKLPGASTPATCSTPINTSLTHDLILAILRGELTNQTQTVAWLADRPSTYRPLPAADSRH